MNSPSNKNLPKSVDFCKVEVILDLKSNVTEEVLFESVQSKSVLQNIIKNNSECTGFLIWFASFCVSCISKSIQKSKYVYSLLVYDESQMTPIQYTKNINGIACLVKAIRNAQKTYHSAEHYQIQFVSCSTKSVDKNERKRIMKNERQKQNYKGMEPSRKTILLDKKQAKDSTNKKELQKKRTQKYKTMDAFKKQRLLDKHAKNTKGLFYLFLRKTLFTYELYNVIKRYCWQINITQTLSLRFLTSPDTRSTNLVSNNFEIFTLLKDDFCSVRLLHSKMLKKSPSSRSHASS